MPADISLKWFLQLIKELGVVGVVILLWYFDSKRLEAYNEIIKRYNERERRYEEAIKRYEEILRENVEAIRNITKSITELTNRIITQERLQELTMIVTQEISKMNEKLFRGGVE